MDATYVGLKKVVSTKVCATESILNTANDDAVAPVMLRRVQVLTFWEVLPGKLIPLEFWFDCDRNNTHSIERQ